MGSATTASQHHQPSVGYLDWIGFETVLLVGVDDELRLEAKLRVSRSGLTSERWRGRGEDAPTTPSAAPPPRRPQEAASGPRSGHSGHSGGSRRCRTVKLDSR